MDAETNDQIVTRLNGEGVTTDKCTELTTATNAGGTNQPINGPELPPDTNQNDMDTSGGRRHRGGKKTRKVNPALKSWVAFVKKVQHEEKITYPKAMKRASIRKSEWKRGGAPFATPPMAGGLVPASVTASRPPPIYRGGMTTLVPASVTAGGSRRRRTKRYGSKKRRGTKRRR